MSTELSMLLYTTLLFFALLAWNAAVGTVKMGIPWAFGNRDKAVDTGEAGARFRRAVENHKEGLILFAPLVLIVSVAGLSSPQTVLGAQIYFGCRVLHAVTYLAGIPYIRSVAWIAGIVGLAMMVIALI